jgi:hypothetical protein
MQTVIVILIVCLAAAYLVKTFIGKSGKNNSCGCGCTSCPTSETCNDKDQQEEKVFFENR